MYLLKTLRGSEKLAIVFWGYCVFGTLLIIGLASFFADALVQSPPLLYLVGAAILLYSVWAHISLWQCAFNAQHHFWGYVARIYVFVIAAAYGFQTMQPKHRAEVTRVVGSAQQGAPGDGFAAPELRRWTSLGTLCRS